MKIIKSMLTVAFVLLAMAVTGCVNDDEPVQGESLVNVGDEVPSFTVTLSDGSQFVSPCDFAARPLTRLLFFNTTCADCRREFERLKSQPDTDNIICISRAESADDVAAYWQANGLTFVYAAVADRSVYSLFATSGIPRIYTVDAGGRIVGAEGPDDLIN